MKKSFLFVVLLAGCTTHFLDKDSGSYKRSAFGAWIDADKDCQNTRQEELINHSMDHGLDPSGCSVVRGAWVDPYTARLFSSPPSPISELHMEHIVPLKWAWDRGANEWTKEKRVAFANDPQNLIPVEGSVNQSKGAKGPDAWQPLNKLYRCEYNHRWLEVLEKYELTLTVKEFFAIRRELESCK